jgi:peptidoglycan/xylan/chitin deacetylase (PgdA/CDA1 family)
MPRTAVTAAVASAALYAAPASASISGHARRVLHVSDRLRTRSGVALTFDDGPHDRGTPAVLEALASSSARATFFLAGEQVVRRPRLASEIVACGHEVGLHCFTHRTTLGRSPHAMRRDFLRGLAAIEDATGRRPRTYRPPHGVFSWAALTLAKAFDLEPVLWSRWARDWQAPNPKDIVNRLTRNLSAGEILLLHDADHYSVSGSWRMTARALEPTLSVLARRELRTVTLPELIDAARISPRARDAHT